MEDDSPPANVFTGVIRGFGSAQISWFYFRHYSRFIVCYLPCHGSHLSDKYADCFAIQHIPASASKCFLEAVLFLFIWFLRSIHVVGIAAPAQFCCLESVITLSITHSLPALCSCNVSPMQVQIKGLLSPLYVPAACPLACANQYDIVDCTLRAVRNVSELMQLDSWIRRCNRRWLHNGYFRIIFPQPSYLIIWPILTEVRRACEDRLDFVLQVVNGCLRNMNIAGLLRLSQKCLWYRL